MTLSPLILEIQEVVCRYYGLNAVDISGDRRAISIARPRQVIMYLAREMTERSYPEIGRKLGDRDHATIIHGVQRVTKLLETDIELQADIGVIRKRLDKLVTGKRNRLAVGDSVSGD